MNAADIKLWAQQSGFDLVGVTSPDPLDHLDHFKNWLTLGRHATMAFLAKDPQIRIQPKLAFPWAKSIICTALNYYSPDPPYFQNSLLPHVARYARGRDYHLIVKERLHRLADTIQKHNARPVQFRCFVDSAPFMEKSLAARAGLGWIGKNSLLINKKFGSWLVLGEIVTDLDLDFDSPAPDSCGQCTLCLDACPTHALIAPRQLNAENCLSYQTFAPSENPPDAPAEKINRRLLGCDLCQSPCPYNQHPIPTSIPDFTPREIWKTLTRDQLLNMTQRQFEDLFADTSFSRPSLDRLKITAKKLP